MNRRQLLSSLAAIGLVAATPEPVRRYWWGHTFAPGPLDRAAGAWERGEIGMQAAVETARCGACMEPFPGIEIITDVRIPAGTVLIMDHGTVRTTPEIEAILRQQGWLRQRPHTPILL